VSRAAEDREAARRAELGAFLRSRRARLQPGAVHLPKAGPRRTPGLRREEVARLAGISAAWYTWLEQGRDIRVSEEVLHRIADALLLSADERRHIALLAARGIARVGTDGEETVPPRLLRFLDAIPGVPAAVLGRYADVLAMNPILRALVPTRADGNAGEWNLLEELFTHPGLRARLSDWESVARECLAHFRTGYVALVGDPRAERIVARLRRESPEFARWWERHELEPAPGGPVVLDHPVAGCLCVDLVILAVADAPGLTLGLLSPADAGTRERMRGITRGGRTSEPQGPTASDRPTP
jgi:transcriptional regulator with XRE-family HTH domain